MSDPLSIGILCHPTYGGSGVLASELALSLADRGHAVHLFSHQVPPRLARSEGPVQMHVSQGLPYPLFARSEERRVGKECRCWWSQSQYKQKTIQLTVE